MTHAVDRFLDLFWYLPLLIALVALALMVLITEQLICDAERRVLEELDARWDHIEVGRDRS